MTKSGRADRGDWEEQYAAGRWDYLAGEGERARYDFIAERVASWGPAPSLLDVGCGECLVYRWIGGPAFSGRYLGVDWSLQALPRTGWAAGHGVVCADAARLPVAGRFDVIVCSEVLYYLDDPIAVVDRLRGLLSGDGELLLSLYRPDPGRHPDWHSHIARIDADLARWAEQAAVHEVCDSAGRRTWTIYLLRKDKTR